MNLSSIVELIRLAATTLSDEVRLELIKAQAIETSSSAAYDIYSQLLENAELAKKENLPVCQDSGLPFFRVLLPRGGEDTRLYEILPQAVARATALNYLRPNAVDTIKCSNTGSGIGKGIPQFEIKFWDEKKIEIGLMLKGGGSENVGCQYSLPDTELAAGRDLDGVARCVIDAVFQAQGKACPPYFIGVGIGGDRASSMKLAKEQFWRRLDNPHPSLHDFERDTLQKINMLEIGPMGLGGKTTALSLKADYLDRIPASYFVSVSITCWAYRRRFMTVQGSEISYD